MSEWTDKHTDNAIITANTSSNILEVCLSFTAKHNETQLKYNKLCGEKERVYYMRSLVY